MAETEGKRNLATRAEAVERIKECTGDDELAQAIVGADRNLSTYLEGQLRGILVICSALYKGVFSSADALQTIKDSFTKAVNEMSERIEEPGASSGLLDDARLDGAYQEGMRDLLTTFIEDHLENSDDDSPSPPK